jgi:hypothetical protein
MVAARVEGMIKGYKALEQSAIALGHKPIMPKYTEINVNSKIYRVVNSLAEARSLHRPDGDKNISIVTLEELVNNHNMNIEAVLKESSKSGQILSVSAFDFEKGDEIPSFDRSVV